RVVASKDEDAVGYLDDAIGVPTSGAIPGFAGRATPQLSIWRHVHVEKDRISALTPAWYMGNATSIIENATQANGWRLVVQTNLGLSVGEVQGGTFWAGGTSDLIIV